MIEGLHFDIPSADLVKLLGERAKHHRQRAEFYMAQAKGLAGTRDDPEQDASKFSGSNNVNPIDQLRSNEQRHRRKAQRMEFLSKYIVANEVYRLDESDLESVGIVESRY